MARRRGEYQRVAPRIIGIVEWSKSWPDSDVALGRGNDRRVTEGRFVPPSNSMNQQRLFFGGNIDKTNADARIQKQPHSRFHHCRFEARAIDRPLRVKEARLKILGFEPGIALHERLPGVARSQHPQDVFDSKPMPANDGFTTEDAGIDHDTGQEIRFIQRVHISAKFIRSPPH